LGLSNVSLGEQMSTTSVNHHEIYKQNVRWGTYGKGGAEHCGGRCPEHQLRWKKLVDCDTDHLQMILKNQGHVNHSPYLRQIIHEILIERGATPAAFDPDAEAEFFNQCGVGMQNFPLGGGTGETRQERQ